jgi:hypothetical protein
VDRAILTGRIDQDLPRIKRVAVEAMSREYSSAAEALTGIANYITDYYRLEMPEFYSKNRVRIEVVLLFR